MDWDPADVAMTNGGFAAIAVAMRTLVEPGDEVIFLSPPWFFYELMIASSGAKAVRVRLEAPGFDLDPATIAAAIPAAGRSPRTRPVKVTRCPLRALCGSTCSVMPARTPRRRRCSGGSGSG